MQIVNAHLRRVAGPRLRRDHQQAQDEQDLAHLLEELIATHAHLKPLSIYAFSCKPSIWATAEALEEVLPAAVARFIERDREMILVSKLLRR